MSVAFCGERVKMHFDEKFLSRRKYSRRVAGRCMTNFELLLILKWIASNAADPTGYRPFGLDLVERFNPQTPAISLGFASAF